MLRPSLALAAIAPVLAGCDTVFGLPSVSFVYEDAGVDAPDAAIDTDGDGRDDGSDNCPAIANADQADVDKDDVGDICDLCSMVADDQHDEDGDGVGDSCDNCPIYVNPGQANADGDQIGDPCDTGPSLDCFGRFDGFGSFRDWISVRGTWSVTNDQLVQSNPEATQALLLSTQSYVRNRAEIVGAFATFGSPGSRHAGVWGAATVNATSSLPDGWLAEVVDDTVQNSYLAVTSVSAGAAAAMQPFTPLSPATNITAGARFRVVLETRIAPAWAARGEVQASAMQLGNTTGTAQVVRQIGIRTHGAIVHFDWIWVQTAGTGTCPPRAP